MNRVALSCWILVVGFVLVPGAARSATPRLAPAQACLDCHGPFDKLIESTAKWQAPSGEKTSPHRYVPHNSKTAEDVPDCTNCHTAHALTPPPTPGSIDVSKVTVEWCYKTCHHEKDFTPCKKCHKTDGK
jgi:hypothetical protein